MCQANERLCYIVTSYLIAWVHTQNDPCKHLTTAISILLDDELI